MASRVAMAGFSAVLSASLLVSTTAMAQESQALERVVKRCYPDFDPITGIPYPACPRANMTSRDREMIDITTDAFKRAANLAKREGTISKEQYRERIERVREARADARSD